MRVRVNDKPLTDERTGALEEELMGR